MCVYAINKLTIALNHKHVRYAVHEKLHEAGYDALLTAQVFLALAAEMNQKGKSQINLHSKDSDVCRLTCR